MGCKEELIDSSVLEGLLSFGWLLKLREFSSELCLVELFLMRFAIELLAVCCGSPVSLYKGEVIEVSSFDKESSFLLSSFLTLIGEIFFLMDFFLSGFTCF
jgi:hypothetical protein